MASSSRHFRVLVPTPAGPANLGASSLKHSVCQQRNGGLLANRLLDFTKQLVSPALMKLIQWLCLFSPRLFCSGGLRRATREMWAW